MVTRRAPQGVQLYEGPELPREEQVAEWLKCDASPIYFITKYCKIYDSEQTSWIPFHLWPAQVRVVKALQANKLTIILKARQLGLTWILIGFSVWQMLFRAQAEVLLFSRRDDEAIFLLDDRLKGMYNRLPPWLQADYVVSSNSHEFKLSNGSTARAFPTGTGDSYTATLAVIDEADLIDNFNKTMRAVKPTIDTGGRMVLLSRSDKEKPMSEFKQLFRAAFDGESPWKAIFLPWHVRPERDEAWYEEQRLDSIQRTGYLDDLHEQYPATPEEALAPRSQDKRIPPSLLQRVYDRWQPLDVLDLLKPAPVVPNLLLYLEPDRARRYVIGVDPAEGNPTSDESALTVLDLLTGEEVAMSAGKFEPTDMANYAMQLSRYYCDAPIMVERNNHGHTVLAQLRELTGTHVQRRKIILTGHDGRPGWMSSSLGKALLYTEVANAVRDEDCMIHSMQTFLQLASIEGTTLRAPQNQHDDRADSFAFAIVARIKALTVPEENEIPASGGKRPLQ